jgi:uronate dehydrogenase
MKTILLTGAAGGVAQLIRPLLAEHYRVRLSDRMAIADLAPGEEFVAADLGDMAALGRAVAGVDGIVHLGGNSLEADWETIRRANIEGTWNLFETARLNTVNRIVFASSNHVSGFHPRTETVSVDRPVRPDSRYGVSKAFGEALGSFYADRYGVEVLSIRIGHIVPRPQNIRDLSVWLSPRDFVQLIRIGLETPGIGSEIVYGVSDNARGWWDNANALRLGYRPQDRSEDHAAAAIAADPGPTGDPRVDLTQGAAFCVAESMTPTPNREKSEPAG